MLNVKEAKDILGKKLMFQMEYPHLGNVSTTIADLATCGILIPHPLHLLSPTFLVVCDSAYPSDTLSSATLALASSIDALLE